ncbi:uncharacterized protein LOC106013961 [Aplysia californica]|uniref:Uncharacterized protein LOC106013961 n=1 Tax=Aplysia californica TaxID=6500 RepID=A0ABM1AEX0_APLCA|nr:uncharacterized protein LOC106013961 [Aplysia californica]
MSDVVDDINERHMRPWSDACHRDNLSNTPLNPFIDQELLYNRHLHVDGSSKMAATGFSYMYPRLELASLSKIVEEYVEQGLLPPSLVGGHTYYCTTPADMATGLDLGAHGDLADFSPDTPTGTPTDTPSDTADS